ncbi:unnamed protein product [Macrosiphum euphorbiae]|uniref:Uncharacterized protein n=1 Tax=Macrosiphum euphorbiae TaxID=13131 RepID=A0AAV0W6E7_9HEMI|nr:unnamed protein product [Macrosiphum euphorbiae]
MDSPVYCKLVLSMIDQSTAEPNSRVAMQDHAVKQDSLRPPRRVSCMIDALDVVVDSWRISTAVGLPPLP